ncbi:MAG: hypothetical protein H6592_04170 [Flavobacteriales bacterium]|nr:hypothetical protein [Flavobacteriales bacterium]
MSAAIDLEWTIIVGTMVFLLMIGFIVVLLLLNNNRRIRHRIEMAEADLRRQQEVRSAEREATEQTLGEIGRELHDSVGQLLTVAQMGFVERLEGAWHDDPKVATAVGALEEGIAEVRRLGRSLNTDLWKERSLVDALEAEAVRIERIGRGRVLLTVDGDPADPPADVKTVLFRTFQEVMNNALKHSGADTMEIGLSGDRLPVLRIADNGRGFDPARVATGGGLLNIRRRCALIGYHADLVTGPGIGCMWTLKPQHE